MTSVLDAKWEVLSDPEVSVARVADWLLARAAATKGAFSVVLSGGTTRRRLYELLADDSRQQKFPWSRTHWFWGDERFVPRDDPRSNYVLHIGGENAANISVDLPRNVYIASNDGGLTGRTRLWDEEVWQAVRGHRNAATGIQRRVTPRSAIAEAAR